MKDKLDYLLPEGVKYFFYWFIYKIRYKGTAIKSGTKISKNVEVGKNVQIGKGSSISGACQVGDYTFINDFALIDASVIHIGKFCSISHNVKIGMRSHPIELLSTSPKLYLKSKGVCEQDYFEELTLNTHTLVGDDVYIGANAIVMAGVNVGTGAVIGAGAIVTKDVPPYSIIIGNPGKVVRYRFSDDIIDNLVSEDIYNKGISEIIDFNHDFNSDFLSVTSAVNK